MLYFDILPRDVLHIIIDYIDDYRTYNDLIYVSNSFNGYDEKRKLFMDISQFGISLFHQQIETNHVIPSERIFTLYILKYELIPGYFQYTIKIYNKNSNKYDHYIVLVLCYILSTANIYYIIEIPHSDYNMSIEEIIETCDKLNKDELYDKLYYRYPIIQQYKQFNAKFKQFLHGFLTYELGYSLIAE